MRDLVEKESRFLLTGPGTRQHWLSYLITITSKVTVDRLSAYNPKCKKAKCFQLESTQLEALQLPLIKFKEIRLAICKGIKLKNNDAAGLCGSPL